MSDVAVSLATHNGTLPDLQILVDSGERAGRKTLTYTLKARDPELNLNYVEFGSRPLATEPQQYFRSFLEDINNLPTSAAAVSDTVGQRLASRGRALANELLPPELQKTLWSLYVDKKVQTLQIQSDEVWIPWEMLKLQVQDRGRWFESPFLCEVFALTRWLRRIPERLHLPLRDLAYVLCRAPDLVAQVDEAKYLQTLAGPRRKLTPVAATYPEVVEALASGRFDGWHFIGHGQADENDPNLATITLTESGTLRPDDLTGDTANLGLAHPLIFLNCCHTGRGAVALTRAGGWAAALLEAGAGAFIGASWATDDTSAAELTRAFYDEFLKGTPLGLAIQRARFAIRRADDPTWLAYTVYGHPLTTCSEAPPASLDEQEPDEDSALLRLPPPELRPPRRGEEGQFIRRLRRNFWTAATLLGFLALLPFFVIKTATRIQLDLVVERVAFTVGGEERQSLITTPLAFSGLTLARFSRLEITPASLSMSGPSAASGNWQPVTEELAVIAREIGSQVSIEPLSEPPPVDGTLLGSFGLLSVEPGAKVILQTERSAGAIDLTVQIDPAQQMSLPVHQPFELTAELVDVQGIEGAAAQSGDGLSLRATPSPDRPYVEIFSGSGGLILAARLPVSQPGTNPPLLDRELTVTEIDFFSQGDDGERLTTLRSAGSLSYPDHRWHDAVELRAEDNLAIDEPSRFRLRRIELDADGDLHLSLAGFAGGGRVGPSGLGRDFRLSLAEKLVGGPLWLWFAGWFFGCLVLATLSDRRAQRGQVGE